MTRYEQKLMEELADKIRAEVLSEVQRDLEEAKAVVERDRHHAKSHEEKAHFDGMRAGLDEALWAVKMIGR